MDVVFTMISFAMQKGIAVQFIGHLFSIHV